MVFLINNPLGYVIVLAVILFSTKLFGLIFRRLRLPEVLGFIVAGILIGPAVFGQFCGVTLIGFEDAARAGTYKVLFALEGSTGANETVSVFSKIGVILIMFSAGLETNLTDIKNTGLASVLMACAGVAVPFVLGFVISLPFAEIGLGIENVYRCVFIGAILTATSVAITVSVLKELGKINTKLGTTIVSAAVIDDVIGIVVLSVVTSIARSGNAVADNAFDAFKSTIYGTIIMIIAFFIVAVLAGFGVNRLFRWMERKWGRTHRISIFSLVVCFVYSWVAEAIFGVADITGAFLAGIILATVRRSGEYVDSKVNVNSYTIFAPVFFANIGISNIDFSGVGGTILLFAFLAVLMGLVGKIIGCGAVAKCFGYNWRQSAIGGVGMMARGEVALIVTQKVTDKASGLGEHALGGKFMIMTVLLILVSSVLTPILLKVLYSKELPLKACPAQAAGGEDAPAYFKGEGAEELSPSPSDAEVGRAAEGEPDQKKG